MKKYLISLTILAAILSASLAFFMKNRYHYAETMEIPLIEYSEFAYPEDPSFHSLSYGKYINRKLTLVQRDADHMDFILQPISNKNVATISFLNIDMRLLIPRYPKWVKQDEGLKKISLIDREWNRQQVRFYPSSSNTKITGGDGYEAKNIFSLELARNCLNAGLWEILLFTKERGRKAIYYHAWFTFPLGHYKRLFERITGDSYWKYWWKLEHWVDPEGTFVDLDVLRKVVKSFPAESIYNPQEKLIYSGEQNNKKRTVHAPEVIRWKDLIHKRRQVQFASFVPPGLYQVGKPWKNEYHRIGEFKKTTVNYIRSKATKKLLLEIQLYFADLESGERNMYIVSGLDLASIPIEDVANYSKGLQYPMGIGIPPFHQNYAVLQNNSPETKPYFALLLDSQHNWLNHHDIAIDGQIMIRDKQDPSYIHIFLLSYERHTLVHHSKFLIPKYAEE
ncbi:MAG: hypothetical protein AAF518_06665 [Spirochaetota bacterium]